MNISHDNEVFKPPLDKPYNPLIAYATGRDIQGQLRVWELDVTRREIYLNGEHGASYKVASLIKTIARCSLAFLRHELACFALEYTDGSVKLFQFDLSSQQLTPLGVDLTNYTNVTLAYVRAINKENLLVAAIGVNGIYMGELLSDRHDLKLCQTTTGKTVQIHRFGLTIDNKLKIEAVCSDESN